MEAPAAKEGDQVVGLDTHVIMIPSPGGPVPTPMPMPFSGKLSAELASTVLIENRAAATEGSKAKNSPSHVPVGGPFQKVPSNEATIQQGSTTVFFRDKAAARHADPAMTCNDPAHAPNGRVIAAGTMLIG